MYINAQKRNFTALTNGVRNFCEEFAMPMPTHTTTEETPESTLLLAAGPKWSELHPESFPGPMDDWLKTHIPEAHFELIDLEASAAELQAFDIYPGSLDEPLYWLTLPKDQINRFLCVWHTQRPGPYDFDTQLSILQIQDQAPTIIVPMIVDVDGKPLRTVDQIIEEERLSEVFLIAADPAWEHYSRDRLPVPLQEWLSNRLPWVRIEQVAGFDRLALISDNAGSPKLMKETPHPMFWVNMNEDEASFLSNGWPLTMPPPKNGADDFTLYVFSWPPIEAANLCAQGVDA